MGGAEAGNKDGGAERLCATDAAKAYKRGLSLCGEGSYDKALVVSSPASYENVAAFISPVVVGLVRRANVTQHTIQLLSSRHTSPSYRKPYCNTYDIHGVKRTAALQTGSSLNQNTPTYSRHWTACVDEIPKQYLTERYFVSSSLRRVAAFISPAVGLVRRANVAQHTILSSRLASSIEATPTVRV